MIRATAKEVGLVPSHPARVRTVALTTLLTLATPGAPADAAADPVFVDASAQVGLDFVHFNGMSGELYFVEMTGGGGAFIDYDRDGDLDLFLVQGHMLGRDEPVAGATFPPAHPLPLGDRLYRNELGPGGRSLHLTDVTEQSGLRSLGYGMGVATGDYDNDGWPDLYVTNFGSNRMFRNTGNGSFADVTGRAGTGDTRWSVSAAFLDFDRDGWLDLYVGNYVDFRLATHKPCSSSTGARDYCGPNAYAPQPDRLFRNRGDGTFEDVTVRAGIDAEYGGALGVVAADFNGDAWIDVYVANDGLPNQLWLNQRDGTFRNEALVGGCAVNEKGQPEASMGVVAGDLDGNGSEDLFMVHLARETNTLYLNDGHGFFRDSSQASGLGMPSWKSTGFGTALLDYDNDGRLDLFIANGAVNRIEEQVRAGEPFPLRQTNQLFRNLGNGRFEELSAQAGGVLELAEVSRGLAVGDVDDDGDPDLLLVNNAGPARLLLNQSRPRRWLGLRLLGTESPRDMLGARVAVHLADDTILWRRAATDGSYASASDPRVLVGLGEASRVEWVRVFWPNGGVEDWSDLPLGTYTTLREGGGQSASGAPDGNDPHAVLDGEGVD